MLFIFSAKFGVSLQDARNFHSDWGTITLQGTNISTQKWHFEDDFPFPKVGYVNPVEGRSNSPSGFDWGSDGGSDCSAQSDEPRKSETESLWWEQFLFII